MGNLGKLCHKHGGNDLCRKHGGNALVYKSKVPEDCVVDVDIGPVDWHCLTYDNDHRAIVACRASFTSGSGTITSDGSVSSTVQSFVIRPDRGASSEVTFILQVTSTSCSGPEDPGVKASLIATQENVCATSNVSLPVSSNVTVVASFDASGRLTGLR